MLRDNGIPIRSRKDYPPPIPKGTRQSKKHRERIGAALKGNTNSLDASGKHFNHQRQMVKCATCGKDLLKKQCHINATKQSFCNMKCLGKANGERLTGPQNPRYSQVELPCSWCGEIILRRRAEIKPGKNFFCSPKHVGLWKAEVLVGDQVYNWKGGYEPYYGSNWRSQRRKAWERDNYTCQRCGMTKDEKGKNPDVHHIKPFRTFGVKNYRKANDLTNLICYCNVCHKIVEEQANRDL